MVVFAYFIKKINFFTIKVGFFVKTHVPCIDMLHHIESQYLLSTQSIAELRGYKGQNSIFEIPLFFIFLHNNIKNLCLVFCSMLRLRIKF